MKKLLCICLSMLLLFIVGISAYAFGPEPESTCSVVEYDQTIMVSPGISRRSMFPTVSG